METLSSLLWLPLTSFPSSKLSSLTDTRTQLFENLKLSSTIHMLNFRPTLQNESRDGKICYNNRVTSKIHSVSNGYTWIVSREVSLGMDKNHGRHTHLSIQSRLRRWQRNTIAYGATDTDKEQLSSHLWETTCNLLCVQKPGMWINSGPLWMQIPGFLQLRCRNYLNG